MNQKEIIARIKEIEQCISINLLNSKKLDNYNVNVIHKKQVEFHKRLNKNRWVFGGNRSGKTECGAVEAIWWARGIHPYRVNRENVFGWVVSVSYLVQRDVAQAKILSYLPTSWIVDIVMQSGKKGSAEYGVVDHIIIKNVFGGLSKIGFKSIDQGREKFQGTSLDFVWFDEEPPKDIYDECRMRVLDREGEIFGTMTPLKGLTWVYDEIYLNCYSDIEVWYETMEWADNPYLNTTEVESLSNSMSKESLECRKYGHFQNSSGMVYHEFDMNVNVIEPFDVPKEWQDMISIDPGLNNPLSCHFYCCDYDGNIYVIGEHYEAKKDIDYHASKIFELADRLGWHRSNKGQLISLIDSAAKQHTLAYSKSVAELFYEKGILVNTNVKKDLFTGIERVKCYLKGNPKLYIFKNCVNLIREMKSYWWGNGDTPKKVDDHALDELRYYIMSKPSPKKPYEQLKSAIQLDKEKLIRNNSRNRK